MSRILLLAVVVGIGIVGLVSMEAGRAGAAPAQTQQAAGGASTRPAPTTKPASEELLLLEDEDAGPTSKTQADNSRCHVCHVNFEREELSFKHAKANVGCAKCHGASDAHIADESWASGGNGTAPDVMYPREKINDGCKTCHTELSREKHKDFLAGKTEQKICTECHGKHRMAARKCKWK